MKANLNNSINELLANWNPLAVPESAAETEYTTYVFSIQNHLSNVQDLIGFLEYILTIQMELDYDKTNSIQKAEIIELAEKIMALK